MRPVFTFKALEKLYIISMISPEFILYFSARHELIDVL